MNLRVVISTFTEQFKSNGNFSGYFKEIAKNVGKLRVSNFYRLFIQREFLF